MPAQFDFSALKTFNGYRMDEVVSSLQKCIRKSQTAHALYWAVEILETEGGKYLRYLHKRLATIAAEDIGAANPEAVSYVWENYQAMKEFGTAKSREPLFLANTIYYLSEICKKSRDVDSLKCLIEFKRKKGWCPPVADEAIDCHTARGRQDRGWKHFCSESSRVVPELDSIKFENNMCLECPKRSELDSDGSVCDGSALGQRRD